MVGGIRECANHESEYSCCNVQYIILHNILYYSNNNNNNEMLLKKYSEFYQTVSSRTSLRSRDMKCMGLGGSMTGGSGVRPWVSVLFARRPCFLSMVLKVENC